MPNHQDLYLKLANDYPFLSVVRYADVEYIGIILNQDTTVTAIYDFASIPTKEMRKLFIELGEVWWWESNRQYPISIFLRDEFKVFKPYLKTFITKDVTIITGPFISIEELLKRKTKRKNIQLVRKP